MLCAVIGEQCTQLVRIKFLKVAGLLLGHLWSRYLVLLFYLHFVNTIFLCWLETACFASFSWQIISLPEGERVTSIIPVSEFAEDQFLVMLTVNGYIKKVSLNSFSAIRSTGIIAIQLVCLLVLFSVIFLVQSFIYCISYPLYINMSGSWWWAKMGSLLHKWWPCGHGFTKWNGHSKFMWHCK